MSTRLAYNNNNNKRKFTTVKLLWKWLIRLCHSLLEKHDGVFATPDFINLKFLRERIADLYLQWASVFPTEAALATNTNTHIKV